MENITKKKPKDYIIATGKAYIAKQFINEACKYLKIKNFGLKKVKMKMLPYSEW